MLSSFRKIIQGVKQMLLRDYTDLGVFQRQRSSFHSFLNFQDLHCIWQVLNTYVLMYQLVRRWLDGWMDRRMNGQ